MSSFPAWKTHQKSQSFNQHVRPAQSQLPNGWGDEKKMQISELGRVHGEQNTWHNIEPIERKD